MNLPKITPTSNDLNSKLHKIGLRAIAQNLNDFIAHATTGRWSPHVLLEKLSDSELEDRSRRSLERRLSLSGIQRFKPMADFDWSWPKKIERDVIERAFTLDFIREARNLVMIGQNGLGKSSMTIGVRPDAKAPDAPAIRLLEQPAIPPISADGEQAISRRIVVVPASEKAAS